MSDILHKHKPALGALIVFLLAWAQGGTWLPEVGSRRTLMLALVALSGPSPLGQFNGLSTTQIGLTLRGRL